MHLCDLLPLFWRSLMFLMLLLHAFVRVASVFLFLTKQKSQPFCSGHLCDLLRQRRGKRKLGDDLLFHELARMSLIPSALCSYVECFGEIHKNEAKSKQSYQSNRTNARLHIKSFITPCRLCLKRCQICSFSSANPRGQAWVLDIRTRYGGDRPPTKTFFISILLFYLWAIWFLGSRCVSVQRSFAL